MNETDENDDENNDNEEDSPILREDGGDVGGTSGTRTRRNPSIAATTHEENKRGGIDASTKGRIKQEDGYSWTQTEEDVEVNITLPTPGVSAKDIQVALQPRHVGVTYRGGGGDQSLLELSLFEAIAVDGSTWTVESKGQTSKVVLVMEKVEQALWSRIYN